MTIQIINADCRVAMRDMAAESVQCVVTSPPYWGLRDYGLEGVVWDENGACEHEWGAEQCMGRSGVHDGDKKRAAEQMPGTSQGQFCRLCGAWRGCLGLEPTVDLFVSHMVEVFREVRRVLRNDGTVFMNLGDSYAGGGRGAWLGHTEAKGEPLPPQVPPAGLKPKDLIGVPWRVAFALQADGWWLRSAIVWAKGLSFCPTYAGSVMPESCTDRPTSAYEMVFLLTKAARYYYDADAVREVAQYGFCPTVGDYAGSIGGEHSTRTVTPGEGGSRNLRNVWAINPQPFPDAHFATFPEALVKPCIKAGSSPRACGVCGAPWERVVEKEPVQDAGRSQDAKYYEHRNRNDGTRRLGQEYQDQLNARAPRTTGWQPTCKHRNPGDDTGRSVILDPFGGSGTVGLVAKRLGRDAILIDASQEYCEMARKRTGKDVTAEMFT